MESVTEKAQIEKDLQTLPKWIDAVRNEEGAKGEFAALKLTQLIGIDADIDRQICKAFVDRIGNGHGFPQTLLWWMFLTLVKRASGQCKSWHEAVKSEPPSKQFEVIDAVERARAKGLKTSRNGEPGEAFEEAERELGLAPSTIRDFYYKNKDYREPYRLSGELAKELVSIWWDSPPRPRDMPPENS
ncbi:MAG: hypothetical protein ACPLXR_05900 [Halothiobacillaceae bacterium]|jgi:hypothetical protein